jgi:RHS repeat-associated protein
MTEELPLILSDGTNSYIYGPGGLPVEQISSGGTVSYMHHDQAGSTRLITGSTGTVTGKCTYCAYGAPTCEGATTTPLGYDAQYTSSDTGLIYLRTRVYDPATAQFLTVDPLVRFTRALYTYAQDNPLNRADPTGLCTGFGPAPAGCTGGPGELGPHVFCEPTKREAEEDSEAERKEEHAREESPGTGGSGLGDTFAGCAAGAAFLVEGGPLGMATGCLYGGTLGALGGDATGAEGGFPFLP